MMKYFISPPNQEPNKEAPSIGGYSFNEGLDYNIITHKVRFAVRIRKPGVENELADVYVFSNYEDEKMVLEAAKSFIKQIFDATRFISLESYVDGYMQVK